MAPTKEDKMVEVRVAEKKKAQVNIENLLHAMLEVTTKTADLEKIEKDDEVGQKAAQMLMSVTENDLKKIIEMNIEEAVEHSRPYDPNVERITVKPPRYFGDEAFSAEDDQKMHDWQRKYKHSHEWPNQEMVLKWMFKYHTDNDCKFSEDTWRENLLALLPTKEQKSAMSAFIKKGVPARIYFTHLQTSFKGSDSKQDALLKMSILLSDTTKTHLEVAKQIEKLMLIIEDDAENFVNAAVSECLRYYASYAGPEVAEKIRVSYNSRDVFARNYAALIECIKLNEIYIKEGRDRVLAANAKKVRQVLPSEIESETYTTQQTKTDGCFGCGESGHFIRECPKNVQKPPGGTSRQWFGGMQRYQQPGPTGLRPQRPCFLHPAGTHTDAQCKTQMSNPCSLPEHKGMKHGNEACSLQRGCQKHNNVHKEKDCPEKTWGGQQQKPIWSGSRPQWQNQQGNQWQQQQRPQWQRPQWQPRNPWQNQWQRPPGNQQRPQWQNQTQHPKPQTQMQSAQTNQVQEAEITEITSMTQKMDDLLKILSSK